MSDMKVAADRNASITTWPATVTLILSWSQLNPPEPGALQVLLLSIVTSRYHGRPHSNGAVIRLSTKGYGGSQPEFPASRPRPALAPGRQRGAPASPWLGEAAGSALPPRRQERGQAGRSRRSPLARRRRGEGQ